MVINEYIEYVVSHWRQVEQLRKHGIECAKGDTVRVHWTLVKTTRCREAKILCSCDECGKVYEKVIKHINENEPIVCRSCSKRSSRNPMYGKPLSEEHKRKLSDAHSGENNAFYGRRHTTETKRRIGNSRRGQCVGEDAPTKRPEVKQKISDSLTGRHLSDEHKQSLSDAFTGYVQSTETCLKKSLKMRGENHWNWQGGITDNEYPYEFSKELKRRIRRRDRCCQNPDCQNSGYRNLQVHHIDYDKQNCSDSNLICLCEKCHPSTNYNRDYWKKLFTDLMEERCYGEVS